MEIELQETIIEHLDTLYHFQMDGEARHLAAFTGNHPPDKEHYVERMSKHLLDETIINRTIFYQGEIVGSVAKFEVEGLPEVTYWIDKKFWGKGIATQALEQILLDIKTRPIYASAAFDNFGSRKVLEKCGFEMIGTDKGFANARGEEIEEVIYELKAKSE